MKAGECVRVCADLCENQTGQDKDGTGDDSGKAVALLRLSRSVIRRGAVHQVGMLVRYENT